MNIDSLKFDAQGLIPAVVQDFATREVLTVAYMNKESLQITMDEGRTCFWSRSRQELWRKGETSGNIQHVVCIYADCDGDSLVVQVVPEGPACHLGTESCFSSKIFQPQDMVVEDIVEDEDCGCGDAADDALAGDAASNAVLDNLYQLLLQRNEQRPEGSYTSYLFNEGLEKILKKVGEESTEAIIAAMKEERGEVIYEISDLCYHVLVLMVAQGISPEEIRNELASRHIIDHKEKQKTCSAQG